MRAMGDFYGGGYDGMDGGGGFVAGTQAGGASQGGGGGGGGGKSRVPREKQTIIPLTIKALKAATKPSSDDPFEVDGHPLHNVTVVATIVEVQERSTHYLYKLSDCTGEIDAKVWVDEENAAGAARAATLQARMYVRVSGTAREYQGELHIQAYDVRAISGGDELTHHLLDAMHAHLRRVNGPYAAGGLGAEPAAMAPGGGFGGGVSAAAPAYGAPAQMAANGMEPVQDAVCRAFEQHGAGDEGAHVNTVISALAGMHDESAVRGAIEFLAAEGHLYSTIDESHYKSTGG